MIASPRSLARKPLVMGALLFGLIVLGAAAMFAAAQESAAARTEAMLEYEASIDAERQARKTAEWNARGGESQPLCDDTPPAVAVGRAAWSAHLDCLAERRRDPRLQLEAAERALQGDPAWVGMQLRRAELLREVGDAAEAIAILRELHDRAEGAERADAAYLLAEALLFDGDDEWDVRRAEVSELVGAAGGPSCRVGALRVIAAWPDDAAIETAATSYGDCAERTSDGELETLMELVAVGAVAQDVDGAPSNVRKAAAEVARNFTIKSPFAMCAEALPDAPGLRETCESVLR